MTAGQSVTGMGAGPAGAAPKTYAETVGFWIGGLAAPLVTSVSPTSGAVGSTVTIRGRHFATTPAANLVRFGAVQATVTEASGDTQLTVTVPAGAGYAPITVTAGGLTGYSSALFDVTFASAGLLDASTLPRSLVLAAGPDPNFVTAGDLDGDGRLDLLASLESVDSVAVFRNTSVGGLSFERTASIATARNPHGTSLGDLDGDGRLDLAVATTNGNRVSVRRNLSAPGSIQFESPVDLLLGGGRWPHVPVIRDFDLDGKPDLVASDWAASVVHVWRNTTADSSLSLDSVLALPTRMTPYGLAAGDLDGDGLPDIVVGGKDTDSLSVFRNVSQPGTVAFAPRYDFGVAGHSAYWVALADFDADGKLDVAASDQNLGAITVFRNQSLVGNLTFVAAAELDVGPFPRVMVADDLDGDGRADLAVVNYFGNSLSVLRNTTQSGSISFAPRNDLVTGDKPFAMTSADLDGNGRPELVSSDFNAASLTVFRNLTFAPPLIASVSPTSGAVGSTVTIRGRYFGTTPAANLVRFGAVRATVTAASSDTQLTVSVPAGAGYAPIAVTAAGLTGYSSALFDVTFASAGLLDTSTLPRALVLAGGPDPNFVTAGDLDGDGRLDLLASLESVDSVAVFRNTSIGGLAFARSASIATARNPHGTSLGDLDGDGRLDLAVGTTNGNRVSVRRNLSAPGSIQFESPVDLLLGGGRLPHVPVIRDFDLDGKPDLVAGDWGASQLHAWRNTTVDSVLSFGPVLDLGTASTPYGVAAGDLDGDGLPDVVVGSSAADSFTVFRNVSQPGTLAFAPRQDFYAGNNAYWVTLADLDGDGKLDLAASGTTPDSIAVFRNQSMVGNLAFVAGPRLDVGVTPRIVVAGDLDGDGRADLAVENSESNSVSVLRNTTQSGVLSFAPKADLATGEKPIAMALADLDGNGRPELVSSDFYADSLTVFRNLGSYTISASAGVNGVMVASVGVNGPIVPTGDMVVPGESSRTFAFKPNQGARVQDVVVDGLSVGAVHGYTFSNIAASHTISVSFAHDASLSGLGWTADGARLTTLPTNERNAVIVEDGAAGAILAWEDDREDTVAMYAQRLNATGVPQWAADGVRVAAGTGAQLVPKIASDGADGAIVVWWDRRNGTWDLYGQRLGPAGTLLWGGAGVPVTTAAGDQYEVKIAEDGAGGAFLAWNDSRGGNLDIYAQRLDASGNRPWSPADGIAVCTESGGQQFPFLVPDGLGGVIISWDDGRNPTAQDIYAQKLDGSGSPQWTAQGVALCTQSGNQWLPTITTDGAGGCIVTWWDDRAQTQTEDIYAQRVSADGSVRWTANGVLVCGAAYRQDDPEIVPDGAGGAIIAWKDTRTPPHRLVVAQRVDSAGTSQWTANGVPVCDVLSYQVIGQMKPDGAGGAIIGWSDTRGGSDYDIYVQRLNTDGAPVWNPAGVPVCVQPQYQYGPAVALDGAGGAIALWNDYRAGTGTGDLYAQRVNAAGVAGFDHTIVSSSLAGGTLAPLGAVGVFSGSSQRFDAVSNPGYSVADLLVDGSSVGAPSGYTFSNLAAGHSILASFALNEVASADSAFLLAAYGFDDPQSPCQQSGWTGEDLVERVFAHVSDRFVVNSGGITMGTKALWFGADSISAPDQVADWVQPYGFGNHWSQRVTTPTFTLASAPDAVLSFDATLDLSDSGGLTDGDRGNEFLAVQGLKGDGTWAFLTARYAPIGGAAFTDTAVAGRGTFHCDVRLGLDGNPAAGLAATTRFRIVVQTDSSRSQEDGGLPAGAGAAVVDNVALRDSASATTFFSVDFEDSTTGVLSPSARNGALRAPGPNASFTRDVAPPASQVEVRGGFDPEDPSCGWTFSSVGDTVANGVFARVTSPWIPTTSRTQGLLLAFTGRLNTASQRRFLTVMVRGKNAGDLRPRFASRLSYALANAAAGGDGDAPLLVQRELRYPENFVAAVGGDSLQLVFTVEDRGEAVAGGLSGRPATRLPFLSLVQLYQLTVDADRDGVPDSTDACAGQSAAGEDADGNGCADSTASLHHVETWAMADRPLRYAISQEGLPAIVDGSDLEAIRGAFATWQGVPGASPPVQELPVTSQKSAAALDGISLVTFEDDFAFPSNVIAVTPTTSFTRRAAFDDRVLLPGQIVDADVIFNPQASFGTATTGAVPGGFDLQSVATHELGHFLGLSHSGVQDATMFPVLQSGTEAASLTDDDRGAIAAAYPGASFGTDYARIKGQVTRGGSGSAVPGALVLAVRLSGGVPSDTAASDVTREDGSYALWRLAPGDYAVRIVPLDGSVPGVTPEAINARVASIAVTDFSAEWWSAPEDSSDDPAAMGTLTMAAGEARTGLDLVTNIDVTPPTVASVLPAAGATGIRTDTAVRVEFSEAVDDGTLSTAFKLRVQGQGGTLGGQGELIGLGTTFVFAPGQPLAYGTIYELQITTDLTDRAGLHLGTTYTTTFATQASPTLALTGLTPQSVPAGAMLTVTGAGFDSGTPGNNRLAFTLCSGCPAETTAALRVTPTSLTAIVPDSAASGPVRAVVGPQVSNPVTLTVLSSSTQVSPTPSGAAIALGFAPSDVALAPDASTAYVVGDAGLATVDLALPVPVPQARVIGAARRVVLVRGVVDPNDPVQGMRAYVTQPDSARVVEVDADPQSGTFGQILPGGAIPVNGEPDGIAIAPSGRRAYVTDRLSDVVFELDTDAGSVTRNTVLRELHAADAALDGGVAVDPSGRMLMLSSSAGALACSLATKGVFTASATRTAGGVAVTPSGRLSLYLRADFASLLALRGAPEGPVLASAEVALGGGPRDVAVTPSGRSALVVDAQASRLRVVDVDSTSSTYLTEVASVATGLGPVAVAVSGDSTLAATVNAADRTLSIYSLGGEGSLVRLVPDVARPGDHVVVHASSSAFPSGTAVDLGYDSVTASHAIGNAVAFTVPAGVQQLAPLTLRPPGGDRSLALPLEVVDPIGTLAPRSTPILLTTGAFACAPDAGYYTLGGLRASPDGNLLALFGSHAGSCGLNGVVEFYQASDRGLQDLGARLGSVDLETVDDAEFTADSRRLWVLQSSAGRVRVLDADPASPTFAQVLATVTDAQLQGAEGLRADPMGRYVYSNNEPDGIGVFSTAGALLDTLYFGNSDKPRSIAPSRDGRYLVIFGDQRLFLYDPATQGVAATSSVRAIETNTRLEITLDGRRAVGHFGAGGIRVWNLDAGSGALAEELYSDPAPLAGVSLGVLKPSPDGKGVLASSTSHDSLYALDVSAGTPAFSRAGLGRVTPFLSASTDGRRLWMGRRAPGTPGVAPDSVFLYSLSPADRMALVAGDGQLGPAGATLPMPVRVQVTAGVGQPQQGVVVRFALSDTMQGTLEGGATTRHRITDVLGEAEVSWTLPQAHRAVSMAVTALGVPGGTLSVGAQSVAGDALAAPTVVALGPADGAAGIHAGTAVLASFSQPMDSSSVATRMRLTANGNPVEGRFSLELDGQAMLYRPLQPLPFGSSCVLTVDPGALDRDGQVLAAGASASFTVEGRPALALTAVSPRAALEGAPVVLSGQGFSPARSGNTVLFNGLPAEVTAASDRELAVKVPVGAVSGPVTVQVGDSTSNAVHFDVLRPQVRSAAVSGSLAAARGVRNLAISPDRERVYVTNPQADNLHAIDLQTLQTLALIPVGHRPQGIAILGEPLRAYVVNGGSNDVSVIGADPDSANYHQVIATIPVGLEPRGVAVSAFGPLVLVVNGGDSTVSVIDARRGSGTEHRVVKEVKLGSGGKQVTVIADGTRAYVASTIGVVEIDLAHDYVTKDVKLGSGGKQVTVSADGTLLLVLTGTGDLVVIDIVPGSPTYRQVVKEVKLGSGGKQVTVSADGTRWYLTTEDANLVYVFQVIRSSSGPDATTQAPGATLDLVPADSVAVGQAPFGIAIEPLETFAVVANQGSGTVTLLSLSAGPAPVQVGLDLVTDTFDLGNLGPWTAGYLEPTAPLAPGEIALASVRLNGLVAPDTSGPHPVGDHDGDARPDLQVSLLRSAVGAVVPEGDPVVAVATGTIAGQAFEARDTLAVRRGLIQAPLAGALVPPGSIYQVQYDASRAPAALWVALLHSFGSSGVWVLDRDQQPNSGVLSWTAPNAASDSARIAVVQVEMVNPDSTVRGVLGESGYFGIRSVTGVPERPLALELAPIRPNPALGPVTVRFSLPRRAEVALEIFDLQGRLVRRLVRGTLEPGVHERVWAGENARGRTLGAGLYFVRLTAEGREFIQRFVWLR